MTEGGKQGRTILPAVIPDVVHRPAVIPDIVHLPSVIPDVVNRESMGFSPMGTHK